MSISYSGIVNYGKATLPSVELWNTNMNIIKDPPKSITTRKIDKVGETTAITEEIAASGDRICEAITRYAKGVNPMVSVSYSNHGSASLQSSNVQGQAFLPYRIAREGAFRPPVRRQEDLLPLSRMPRVWTTVLTQPYVPEYTRRIKSCGTAENTKEVKTQLLRANCQSRKVIMTDPNVNAPRVMGMVKDPLNQISVQARKTCPSDAVESQKRKVTLLRNHPVGSVTTNNIIPVEKPVIATRKDAIKYRAHAMGQTNNIMRGENPTVAQTYNRLTDRLYRGGVGGKPCIPSVTMHHPQKQLIKVR
jgi:hypothetical protein